MGSFLTEAGDLFESYIKRKVGIKDMGKIMGIVTAKTKGRADAKMIGSLAKITKPEVCLSKRETG